MHIAMLAPIKRPLTPHTTVSRLRIMAYLIEGLKNRGHKITVFGTADSYFPGVEIVGVVPKGLNFLPAAENPFYRHTAYLTMIIAEFIKRQAEFDLVHNHMYPEFLPLLAGSAIKIPMVTTVHAQMTDELREALARFPQAQLIAISQAAKRRARNLPMEVVYNGIDTDLFVPDKGRKREYLLFVGRMSKAKDKQGRFLDPKGATTAIKVAQKTGERLKIVSNVEDRKFYEQLVEPHLNKKIQFVGEVSKEQQLSRKQMVRLYQGAKALINPINWEEPFGLVMVEAMACGTPVIAYERGSVPELIVDGETGYIIKVQSSKFRVQSSNSNYKIQSGRSEAINKKREMGSQKLKRERVIKESGIQGLCRAVERLNSLSSQEYQEMQRRARQRAVENFSKERMVEEYEKIYFGLS